MRSRSTDKFESFDGVIRGPSSVATTNYRQTLHPVVRRLRQHHREQVSRLTGARSGVLILVRSTLQLGN